MLHHIYPFSIIGSIIDKLDLQSYVPLWREPVSVKLRENTTLYGVSPPGSGALLAFMMSVLDGYTEMDKRVVNDDKLAVLTYHRIAETFKHAYGKRSLLEDSSTPEVKKVQ